MEDYELTVVLPGKATTVKKKSETEKIEKLVKTLKGKVKDTKDWGKIELAYDIGKEKFGNFLFFTIELNKGMVKSLQDKLKLNEGIIRYLLVKGERAKK